MASRMVVYDFRAEVSSFKKQNGVFFSDFEYISHFFMLSIIFA